MEETNAFVGNPLKNIKCAYACALSNENVTHLSSSSLCKTSNDVDSTDSECFSDSMNISEITCKSSSEVSLCDTNAKEEATTVNKVPDFTEMLARFRAENTKNLIFGFLNINSLRYKFYDVKHLLTENLIDIFAICETKLDDSFPNCQFNIPEHKFHRRDHNYHGGGVAIYVRSDITHKIRNDLDHLNNDLLLQYIVLEIWIRKEKWLICCMYKAPTAQHEMFTCTFGTLLELLYKETKNILVMGDINFDMLKSNPLLGQCELFDLKNIVKGATCFKGNNPTSIDVVLSSNPGRIKTHFNFTCGVSDHHNIVGVSTKITFEKQPPRKVFYRTYKHFNEKDYSRDLSYIPISVVDIFDDTDDKTWAYEILLTEIIDEHAPIKKRTLRKHTAPFMNSELRKAIHKKSMLRNRYYKSRNSKNWDSYKKQRNVVNYIRRKSIKHYFRSKCQGNKNSTKFWDTIRPFITDKCSEPGSNITLMNNDSISNDPIKVCEIFNEFFSNVANDIGFIDTLPVHLNSENMADIYNCHTNHASIGNILSHNCIPENEFSFSEVSSDYVYKIISKLDPHKATGYDNIPPKLLKLGGKEVAFHFTYLINSAISTSSFPDTLKLAEISAIYKKNDNLLRNNYRPISVLSVISKLFEITLTDQLDSIFGNIFSPLLSAYRKHYSTQDVLINFTEDCKHYIDKDCYVTAILMDLSKAFDCIPHKLLICKLRAYGFSNSACLLISSYLHNRFQRVKLGHVRSSWSPICKGVPQGSNLGPTLFNIFLNDIFYSIKDCLVYNYADDNTLLFYGKDPLQMKITIHTEIEKIIKWFEINGMQANPSKFQLIHFGPKGKDFPSSISLRENVLQPELSVKLLGVTFDCMLTFSDHLTILCKKAGRQINVLRRLSKFVDLETRILIYRTFIMSNFNYCAPVWHFCSKEMSSKLELIQIRALRFVFNDYSSNGNVLIEKAGSDTLLILRLRAIAVEVYKSINNLSPAYVNNLFETKYTKYDMRDSVILKQPHYNTKRYGFKSLRYFGSKLWNNLPPHLKENITLQEFKTLIKLWSGKSCSCELCISMF